MEGAKREYVKRTQKDYTISFKLSVVKEYEPQNISLGVLKKNMAYKEIAQFVIG